MKKRINMAGMICLLLLTACGKEPEMNSAPAIEEYRVAETSSSTEEEILIASSEYEGEEQEEINQEEIDIKETHRTTISEEIEETQGITESEGKETEKSPEQDTVEELGIPYETLGEYFLFEGGELLRNDTYQRSGMGNLNSHFGCLSFEVGDGIWVGYTAWGEKDIEEYIEEHEQPKQVEITNPDVDFGYRHARAGMNFEEIQALAGEKEVKQGFFDHEEWVTYYLEYDDGLYNYVYWSWDETGEDSTILINHSQIYSITSSVILHEWIWKGYEENE